MAYSTEANVREQSPFKDSVNISSTYITQKISEADSVINAAIGQAYVLPLTTVPDIIEGLSEAITILTIFQEQNPNAEVEPGLSVKDALEYQQDILEKIRTRKLQLFDPTTGDELPIRGRKRLGFYPSAASSDASDVSNIDSTEPKFTMNKQF